MTRRTPRWVRWRSCGCKQRYATRRDAFRAANAAEMRSGRRHRVYQCEYGEHYHVTHVSKATFDYYQGA